MGQDLRRPGLAEHIVEDLPALGRYFVPVRVIGVGLAEVGFLKTPNSLERPVLRIAGEAPRADRGADQVHRFLHSRDQRFGYNAVGPARKLSAAIRVTRKDAA
jgi:hypothetical protein